MRQPDLFENDTAAKAEPYVYVPNLEEIRGILHGVLTDARSAATVASCKTNLRYYKVVLPQMSRWLPDGERARLIVEFDAEIRRLEAA